MKKNAENSAYIQELELKSKLLKRAEQIAGLGHWQINVADGLKLFWSDQIFKIHGLDKDDGIPDVETAISLYHPDDQEKVKHYVERSLKYGEDYQFELRVVRPNGEIRHVTSYGECEKDDRGNVIAVFGVFKDVTNYKVREQEAMQATKDLERVIENIPDFVFVKDSEFKIVRANQAFISLYPEDKRDKIIGYTTLEDYEPDEVELFVEQDKIALKDGYAETLEEISFPNGEKRTVLTKKVGYDDEFGNRFSLGISRDLTEIIAIQQNLIESNIELERFAYLASHDLQEPLRMITSFTKLLKDEYADKLDEMANKYIDFSTDAAVRMQNLINDLLEYSRLDHGDQNIESVDLAQHLKISLKNLHHVIDQTGAKIVYDELPTVMANPLGVTSLFQNLIGNALKYKKEGVKPEIHVRVADDGDNWLFSIADNGIGIKEEYKDKIFGIFQRLHSKNEYSGTGIGLATCRKIVTSMNGKIWIESVHGEGSTFYFTIPKINKGEDNGTTG